jgi:hypothetical protein
MRAYVVYDQESGRIVHAHTQVGEAEKNPAAILALVDAKLDRHRLKVLPLEEPMAPGAGYRVNPKTSLLEKDNGAPGGGGGGSAAKKGRRAR